MFRKKQPAIADFGGKTPGLGWYRRHIVLRRKPESIFIYELKTGLGITLWRRGAVSLQVRGHFLQVVLGDWWKAMPHA